MEDPVIHRNLFSLLWIFVTFATDSQAFSQGSIGSYFYVNFMISEFSYLNITSTGRNLIQDEIDCGYACLEIPSCFSYNVAAFPDFNGKRLCELLPSDKFNNSGKLKASREFHHFYIPSLCDSSPCKNAGKCISLYQENGYKCICVEGFTGKNCETNINDCANITCFNNGTCIDLINGFNCSCPPGFAGSRCEIRVCEPVGVADPHRISNAQMTASSYFDDRYYPYHGRLDGETGSGWGPNNQEFNSKTGYLQVDMGTIHIVCAVATQGPIVRSDEWTSSYILRMSLDDITWNTYKENNTDKVFQGNSDHISIVKHSLPTTVKARFVRFYYVTFHSYPAIRVEIYISA